MANNKSGGGSLIWGWAFEDGSVLLKLFKTPREIHEFADLPKCFAHFGISAEELYWSEEPWPVHREYIRVPNPPIAGYIQGNYRRGDSSGSGT
ncbi:hypothetical protein [Glycomyces sp. NPDC047010]|uniref:hypothetical protein n=1 Tax=Glycomyces sp. NPDC047010 TaxID=3155023 RepID=UPI0033E55A56